MKKIILFTITIFISCFVNAQSYTVKLDTTGLPPSYVPVINNVPLSVTITPVFATTASTFINVQQNVATSSPWTLKLQRSGVTYTISNTNMNSWICPFDEILTTTAYGIQPGDKIIVIKDRTMAQGDLYTVVFNISGTPPPVANFTISSPNYVNTAVNFTDLSTNSPTSWGWQINSPTSSTYTSTVQNPSITFTTAGTYTAYLISSNGTGQSGIVSHTFTVSVATNINEPLSNSLKIYPNPVNDFINLEFEKLTNIKITDVIGQVLYNNSVEKTKIETSNYTPGIYLIKTENYSYKFIKQ